MIGEDVTAKGDPGGSDDARLNNGVLLPRERLFQDPSLVEYLRPRLHEEEAQQPRGDVERRDDPRREVQLHHHEGEEDREDEAHYHRSERDLVLPRGRRIGALLEDSLHGDFFGGGSSSSICCGIAIVVVFLGSLYLHVNNSDLVMT